MRKFKVGFIPIDDETAKKLDIEFGGDYYREKTHYRRAGQGKKYSYHEKKDEEWSRKVMEEQRRKKRLHFNARKNVHIAKKKIKGFILK